MRNEPAPSIVEPQLTVGVKVSVEEAVRILRNDPNYAPMLFDAYLDEDREAAVSRFACSREFESVLAILRKYLSGGLLLDLGAGRGIASDAFAQHGFAVVALEPDEGRELGAGAIRSGIGSDSSVSVVAGVGESLPFKDSVFDVIYLRQVLHHFANLELGLSEIARVLKPGGVMAATREHVVDDDEQLQQFLDSHPIHVLAGGEGAFSLPRYINSIRSAGLQELNVIGPWESVINAFPAVEDDSSLATYPRHLLEKRFGSIGSLLGKAKLVQAILWKRLNRPVAGRMYSFVAQKPLDE